jgi:murein DD-endopeptidase MepM/ murein hydrolase activator NlpD
MGHLHRWRWIAVLATGALLFESGTVARAGFADRIDRQRSALEAIHARIKQKRAQLRFEELREADYRRQFSETSASIAAADAHLRAVEQRVAAERDDQEREERLLGAALAALHAQRRAYGHRLVQMYEQPPATYWSVLLGSRSFSDFVERWDDVRFIAAEDQREVRARNRAVRRVEEIRLAIAASVVRLEAQREQQAQIRNQLAALGQERENLVAVAARERSSVAGDVERLDEISAQEEAQLEQLLREQQAEVERERAAGRAAIVTPPGAGGMQWPLSGPITSPFGYRLNPFGGGNTEFHPGIDIAVPVGTTVAAAAAGRVIIAGWVSGYGTYVAIDHGDGISTGYGHLSQIFVAVGQDVQRGQAIGASGNTGRSTGPHLIFEVRRNGSPVDPNPFLR